MPRSAVMQCSLPLDDMGTPGGHGPRVVGACVAISRKIEESRAKKRGDGKAAALHGAAAPFFAAVLDAFGKDAAAAELLNESKQEIGDMRTGARGVAFWQLCALLWDSDAAFLAFVKPFLDRHGLEVRKRQRMTRDEAQASLLRFVMTRLGVGVEAWANATAAETGLSAAECLEAVR